MCYEKRKQKQEAPPELPNTLKFHKLMLINCVNKLAVNYKLYLEQTSIELPKTCVSERFL